MRDSYDRKGITILTQKTINEPFSGKIERNAAPLGIVIDDLYNMCYLRRGMNNNKVPHRFVEGRT